MEKYQLSNVQVAAYSSANSCVGCNSKCVDQLCPRNAPIAECD